MAKKLNTKELETYRELLLEKLAVVTGGIESGTLTGAESRHAHHNPAAGDSADQGSEAFEQDFALTILENESNVVQKIDSALERIDRGSYGICRDCEKRIARVRLKVLPWADFCMECQRKEETL